MPENKWTSVLFLDSLENFFVADLKHGPINSHPSHTLLSTKTSLIAYFNSVLSYTVNSKPLRFGFHLKITKNNHKTNTHTHKQTKKKDKKIQRQKQNNKQTNKQTLSTGTKLGVNVEWMHKVLWTYWLKQYDNRFGTQYFQCSDISDLYVTFSLYIIKSINIWSFLLKLFTVDTQHIFGNARLLFNRKQFFSQSFCKSRLNNFGFMGISK